MLLVQNIVLHDGRLTIVDGHPTLGLSYRDIGFCWL